jgi:hypothetical protein
LFDDRQTVHPVTVLRCRATMAVTEAPAATKVCSTCGEEKPLEEFNRDAHARDGRTRRCGPCDRRFKRDRAHGIDWGHREVEEAPDRRPAVRLRQQLVRHRRAGLPFDEAWPAAVEAVVSEMGDRRIRWGWRAAFEETRWAWESGYDRRDVTAVTGDLLDAA